MENKIQVSFIVPAYNMERYLHKAIQGILNQNNISYEIIIVNDGSKDLTARIADEYAMKYSCINVIHKSNGGISSARNAGLQMARGEYICFLDSDDFYSLDFAYDFYKQCKEHNLDAIRGLYKIYEDKTKTYKEYNQPNVDYYNQVLSGAEFLHRSIKQKANEVVPWLGFYKREYLLKHEIVFPEGIVYEEDQIFFLQVLLCDKECRVLQVDVPFYSYRYREDSVTKTPTLKQAEDVVWVVKEEHKYIKELNGIDKKTRKAAYRYSCSSFYQLTSIYGRVASKDRKAIWRMAKLKQVRMCLKYPYDRHQFIKIFMFKFMPHVVNFIYKKKLKKTVGK